MTNTDKNYKKNKKPTRKLSDISFEHEGAHLALVSPEQGGPANGHDYALLMKSTKNFSDEFIQKMQQVKVTLELPEFLQRFFCLDYYQADLLAGMMGYDFNEKYEDNSTEGSYTYADYIAEELESFELMKALYEAENIADVLETTTEEQYLALLRDQAKLEPYFKELEAANDSNVSNSDSSTVSKNTKVGSDKEAEGNTEVKTEATKPMANLKKKSPGGWKPTNNNLNKEELMTKKTDQEVLEKSEVDTLKANFDAEKEELQKSFDNVKAELQKAKEMLEKVELEKKAEIRKARFTKVKDVVKSEDNTNVLFKALDLVVSDEDFNAILKCLETLQKAADESDIFKEKGLSLDAEVDKNESKVAKILKQQYNKQ